MQINELSYSKEESQLPARLREIVKISINILGQCIRQTYGEKTYKLIEQIRSDMVRTRGRADDYKVLSNYRRKFGKFSDDELSKVGQAFSLYMELINRCEKAYRCYRLQDKEYNELPKKLPLSQIYVFTAHPTEARSQSILKVMDEIEDLLIVYLERKNNSIMANLENLISLSLAMNLAETQKPQVKDEARNIFDVILNKHLIMKQVELRRKKITVHFRTWVGGDKDGHPFVTEKTMLESWTLSRQYFIDIFLAELANEQEKLSWLDGPKVKNLKQELKTLERNLTRLKLLAEGDGHRVVALKNEVENCLNSYQKSIQSDSPGLRNIADILWLYPAVVMPVEIREDSSLVREALEKDNMTIEKMLKTLKKISKGKLTKWYARGFVLSMTESSEDMASGYKLLNKVFGAKDIIPVVPLFETRLALETSQDILKTVFEKERWLVKTHQKIWGSRFEIMLGYSDSSKESGVFMSRLLIATTLQKLATFFKGEDLDPVFFHGSGGSIERGGGSLKEQTAFWPKEALNIYKSTIQGEMIPRRFGDPQIMESSAYKIIENYSTYKAATKKTQHKIIFEFSDRVARKYQDFISAKDFPYFLSSATPYSYLDQLKIGSRPTKRQSGATNEIKLRAIPWVLCWTQTRVLFPTWWGVGSAWDTWDESKRYEFMRLLGESDFLQTYLKILGFTLAKVELSVFRLYLEENLTASEAKKYYQQFVDEFELTKKFFKELTQGKDYLWFRPWLQESITLRSCMIHPVNLVQLEALKRKDATLLRESVTGIACGMLTTG